MRGDSFSPCLSLVNSVIDNGIDLGWGLVPFAFHPSAAQSAKLGRS